MNNTNWFSKRRFLRGRAAKLKEIEIFLIDNENERLNNEYGKIEERQDEGIGVGRYAPDYIRGIEILKSLK